MFINQARNLAKKLAKQENRGYAIWIAESIYLLRKKDVDESKNQYIVKVYNSYDKYKEGFVEYIK